MAVEGGFRCSGGSTEPLVRGKIRYLPDLGESHTIGCGCLLVLCIVEGIHGRPATAAKGALEFPSKGILVLLSAKVMVYELPGYNDLFPSCMHWLKLCWHHAVQV